MSFSDHKITQFTHRISELADQPNMPADELKARFDSSPEELRQSVNGICDDATRLEARVEGIVVETFGDTIDKSMLSTELAAELDAKATQTALASETAARESAVSAEASARQSADTNLQSQITTVSNIVAQKVEIYIGNYTGTGTYDRTVSLSVQPKVMFVASGDNGIMYLVIQGKTTMDSGSDIAKLNGKSLVIYNRVINQSNTTYHYIAFI